MIAEQPCPNFSELLELLDGKLVDPELSKHASHLESCSRCQQQVSRIASQGNLTEALLGTATAFDRICSQTPPLLVERIKQIPMLIGDISESGYPDSSGQQESLNSPRNESVAFSFDSTQGGLGRLGPYRIFKLLGSGGMGSVFLAEDSNLHRQVALKVMLPKIARDPLAKQRFLREARAAASLKSDHIVTVHHVDEENNVPYLAMELLVGRSLDEAIRSGDELSVDAIVHVAMGVARGLADAHEKGMIHRDIKPGNIWLESSGDGLPRVKILDFGLARMDVDETHLTHASAIVGTPAFMAPEQARGEKSVDARSDLFSLGCVLYYLSTCEVPFKADTMLGTLMSLAVDTPDAPSDRNPSIPLRLSRLTMQLLEKDAINRPQSAREVALALRDLKHELESGVAEFANTDAHNNLVNSVPSNQRRLTRWSIITLVVGLLMALTAYPMLTRFDAIKLDSPSMAAIAPAISPSIPIEKESTDDLLDRQANEQFGKLLEQFKADNPRLQGTLRHTAAGGKIVSLTITGANISNLDAVRELKSLKSLSIEGGSTWDLVKIDLSSLEGLSLSNLSLYGGYVTSDLSALRGMPLEELAVDYSPVSDLKPLESMPLRRLVLWHWVGSDLTPLRGMPLEHLNIGGNNMPMDLAPLAGAPLSFLCINLSQVADLSPLKGMPLKSLYCSNTHVADLSPIQTSPIEELMVRGTNVKDISMAKDWPLTWLEFNYELRNWYSVLKDIPTLRRINDQNAAIVLADFDAEKWPVEKTAFVNSLGMEFMLVPHGQTLRSVGNFDQFLVPREIEIAQDFYLGRYEVTQEEWMKVMGVNPSYFSRQGPGANKVKFLSDTELAQLPVERVSWLDCQRFLDKLNELESDQDWIYRLPTEAEWTFACQGGPKPADFDSENAYYFDKPAKILLSHKANTQLSDLQRPSQVGIYRPNSLGLFDMHGNVWEWCDDLANVPNKRARWIHGGCWRDEAEKCRASYVSEPTEPWTYFDLGLRVARVRK